MLLINMDMDNVIKHPMVTQTIHHALAMLQKHPEIMAVFPNSHGYYDFWALRLPMHNFDYWHDMTDRERDMVYKICLYFFQLLAMQNSIQTFDVLSAFNGMAVYRTVPLLEHTHVQYDGSTTCEHVQFHQKLREATQGRLCIVPQWLN
jgi:hypothetical protein